MQDAASSLLAAQTGADQLLLLTDAPEVYEPTLWPAKCIPIRSPITPNEIFQLGDFANGSMAPKVMLRRSLRLFTSLNSIIRMPESNAHETSKLGDSASGFMLPQGKRSGASRVCPAAHTPCEREQRS